MAPSASGTRLGFASGKKRAREVLTRPPVPRPLERACPSTTASPPGQHFRPPIAWLISIVIDGVTLAHHPAAQVLAINRANGNDTAPVFAIWLACDVATADEVVEGEGGISTTSVILTVCVLARLTSFESVHAGEANTLITDFDGVSVNHSGLTDDGIGGVCGLYDRQR